MELINATTLPLVAMDFMNKVHEEDVAIINTLFNALRNYEADDSQSNQLAITLQFQEWFEHTIAHFQGEEEQMLHYHFPAYEIHKQEHNSALLQMDDIFRTWQSTHNAFALITYLSDSLAPWLHHHIQTMDTATAQFLHTQTA